jgi:hypothetical protein
MSGAVLVTKRIFKLSFMLTISSAIASVFGILEIFAMAMAFTERTEDYIKGKYKSKKNLNSLVESRYTITTSFEYKEPHPAKKIAYFNSPTRSENFKTSKNPSIIVPISPYYLDTTQVVDLDN